MDSDPVKVPGDANHAYGLPGRLSGYRFFRHRAGVSIG